MSTARQRLEDMLRRAGGFRREGTALVASCPRCGKQKLHFRIYVPADHRAKAELNQVSFRFSCFSGSCTGWDGKPEFALAELLGVTVGAARAELYGSQHVLVARPMMEDPFADEDEVSAVDEPAQWPSQFYPINSRPGEPGAAYLAGRGVPVEVAAEYDVRYSVIDRALAFPVTENGILRGWQLRLTIPHEWRDPDGTLRSTNKATTSPGLLRTRWMFGDRMLGAEEVVVVEGPLDAVKGHLCGGNAAAMGKVLTPALLAALGRYPWRRLYAGLDAGTGVETERLVREFDQEVRWPGREVFLVEWPEGSCGSCGGSGRVEPGRPCAGCRGRGKVQLDAGALSFVEARECVRAARRVRSGVAFFL